VLKTLRELIDKTLKSGADVPTPAEREHALRFATAVLLVEVARADFGEAVTEETTIRALLQKSFELSADETAALLEEAKAEADHAASLQAFTRRLHESLTVPEKHQVVEMLWRVALADEHLDKHEDHLVRKIAGLLYVSHADLIRISNRVHPAHR
jgi:uncharacterized tellurite resistance protein B-like protein